MNLSEEKITLIEFHLDGQLTGPTLAAFEEARKQGEITEEDIVSVKKMKMLLKTALVQQEVLNSLHQVEKQPSPLLRLLPWSFSLAACLAFLYLSFSPIELSDSILQSLTKGGTAPEPSSINTTQDLAIQQFTAGQRLLSAQQPALATKRLEKALEAQQELNERFVAYAQYHLCYAYLQNGQAEKAHLLFEQATAHGIDFEAIGWFTRFKLRWQIFVATLF